MILNSIGSGLGSDCTGGVGSVGRKGRGGVHVDELVPVSLESDSVSVVNESKSMQRRRAQSAASWGKSKEGGSICDSKRTDSD